MLIYITMCLKTKEKSMRSQIIIITNKNQIQYIHIMYIIGSRIFSVLRSTQVCPQNERNGGGGGRPRIVKNDSHC